VQDALREVVALVCEPQPQATIVLMGAYDPPAHGRQNEPHRAVVDRAVQDAAAELGLTFLSPIFGGLSVGQPASSLSPDGLRATAFGYGVMGTRLAQALRGLLPS